MTDPFAPGRPDGPPVPSSDPLADDPNDLNRSALEARREAAEALLRATTASVAYLTSVVSNDHQDPKDRIGAAKALLSFSGLGTVTGRLGPPSTGTDPLTGLEQYLSGAARSPWAASAVGRTKCPEPSCDWPVHRGGELAHGHTQEAGYQDGCGYRHSMMDSCGPVPDGRSTRSNFWDGR